MHILALQQEWFRDEWRAMGMEVTTAGFGDHFDLPLTQPLIHIHRVIESLKATGRTKPDVIVVYDNSAPVLVQGFDEYDIPAIFYSVDTHHHSQLHKYYSFLFDDILIAQRDYEECFTSLGVTPRWMPLWASRHIEPSADKKYQAVFVGTMSSKLNPERVKFFDALKERASIHIQGGAFWEIFPHSEVVVNQTVKGDLNFRVFEAMMSGAALLTEACGNGLLELFRDGEHLVTYQKNNVEHAGEQIRQLLSDLPRCRAIGAQGREIILSHHTARHRAETLLGILECLKKRYSPLRHYSAMLNFASLGSRLERYDTQFATQAYLASLKAGQQGLECGEPLSEELACFAVIACAEYERKLRTGAATLLIEALSLAYPQIEVLGYARIRDLLNQGRANEAANLAKDLSKDEAYVTFLKSETLVSELLQCTQLEKNEELGGE